MLSVYILVALTLTCHGDAPPYRVRDEASGRDIRRQLRNPLRRIPRRARMHQPSLPNNLRNTLYRDNFQEEIPQARPTKPMQHGIHYPGLRASEQSSEIPNLNNTHFCSMPPMMQQGATLADDSKYPWIARVVAGHSLNKNTPLLCTAAAIKEKRFITAARCIVTAKAEFTNVIYHDLLIGVKVFLTVAKREFTKQLFDDVGLIITWAPWKNKSLIKYYVVPRTLEIRVNDNSYNFFEEWAANDYTVVGYLQLEDSPQRQDLFVLDNMHASNSVCNKVYLAKHNSHDYWVPCVHSCDHEAHLRETPDLGCYRYMFGLGHMVLNKKGELIGIVTWTCGNLVDERRIRKDLPLPLGIAVPNKKSLTIELECSDHIAVDSFKYNEVTRGYFWELCANEYGPYATVRA